MAHVNGKPYRSFGQGARREKEKESMSTDNNKTGEGENEVHDDTVDGGKKVTIHEKEDGGYRVKHYDGSKDTHHQNVSEMLDHVSEHFGKDEEEEGDYNEPEEEQASEEGLGSLNGSLKSLLG